MFSLFRINLNRILIHTLYLIYFLIRIIILIFAKEITKESAGIKIAVTVFAVIHTRTIGSKVTLFLLTAKPLQGK